LGGQLQAGCVVPGIIVAATASSSEETPYTVLLEFLLQAGQEVIEFSLEIAAQGTGPRAMKLTVSLPFMSWMLLLLLGQSGGCTTLHETLQMLFLAGKVIRQPQQHLVNMQEYGGGEVR